MKTVHINLETYKICDSESFAELDKYEKFILGHISFNYNDTINKLLNHLSKTYDIDHIIDLFDSDDSSNQLIGIIFIINLLNEIYSKT